LDEFIVTPDGEMPLSDSHEVIKGELDREPAIGADLRKSPLSVMRRHRRLIAIEGDGGVVK